MSWLNFIHTPKFLKVICFWNEGKCFELTRRWWMHVHGSTPFPVIKIRIERKRQVGRDRKFVDGVLWVQCLVHWLLLWESVSLAHSTLCFMWAYVDVALGSRDQYHQPGVSHVDVGEYCLLSRGHIGTEHSRGFRHVDSGRHCADLCPHTLTTWHFQPAVCLCFFLLNIFHLTRHQHSFYDILSRFIKILKDIISLSNRHD